MYYFCCRKNVKPMEYRDLNIQTKSFSPGAGTTEHMAVIEVCNPCLELQDQIKTVIKALEELQYGQFAGAVPVFQRWMLSDAATQQETLLKAIGTPRCALSLVEQPPLGGGKLAVWTYYQTDVVVEDVGGGTFLVKNGRYVSQWTGSITLPGGSSRKQTSQIWMDYIEKLNEHGFALADNCVRTWFFVQNIDVNYQGMVTARNEVFTAQGLTRQTHFIASTGIGGRCADKNAYVMMDALAVGGLADGQVSYISAPTHLNNTADYGVSFERGTKITYGDRSHIFISGTASIDNKGKVMYAGDIRRQTGRMLENVEKLLENADSCFADIMQASVYLRDIADYAVVNEILRKKLPGVPYCIVYAPVCRPGWLIEMECIAMNGKGNIKYNNY